MDQIEAFGITDPTARLNALISGDIQMAANMDPKTVSQVDDAEGVQSMFVASGRYPSFVCRVDTDPFTNSDFKDVIES